MDLTTDLTQRPSFDQPDRNSFGRLIRGRFSVAFAFGCVSAIYLSLTLSNWLTARGAQWLNDAVWTVISAYAAWVCWVSSRSLDQPRQRAWQIISAGCAFWFAGQLVWDYYELALGALPTFPHWMQALYVMYPASLIVGLLSLPRPDMALGLNVRRAGNMGLLVCALVIVLIVVVTEPAARFHRPLSYMVGSLIHGGFYPLACVVALYLLWSYRWQHEHWPLLLIVVGLICHTSIFISDVHHRIVGTYNPNSILQLVWIVSFAATACAAHEHAWSRVHGASKDLSGLLRRERWIEAVMPALLGLTIAAVLVLNVEWISPRVIFMCAAAGMAFAVVLGIREAWTQKEEHRLIAALNDSRDRLLITNIDLKRSDQQVRMLNAELELRVADRTKELESAYRELESFSYAVAHDIKAPLRAVNAFGALLMEEHGGQLDGKARGYVERMQRGALQMAQLVDDLLAYAHVERLELRSQATNIAALIDQCITDQSDEIARLGAHVIAETTPVTVHADGAALAQALRNLLQNALKFSRRSAPPRVSIRVVPQTGRVHIVIADNGIGFDMQYHDRIFALFQRLHRPDEYPGTGIGLAIARKAVERMGGRIWAESQPNAGATFFVELPLQS